MLKKTRKTKTSVFLETADTKSALCKDRKQLIRDFAGWMSPDEAAELRESMQPFSQIHEGDWA